MSARRPGAAGWPPVHETGLAVAELDLHGGALFWDEVRAITAAGPLDALVDALLADPATPRVWLFLDEPGETATRAAAALAAARALIARRRSVIVLDGDDRRPDLTRWAGRAEREGWIDFVRYGASLAACSVPLPWEEAPGRLLGGGSFAPADATAAEVAWLLALLGTHAEFVLVAAPLDARAALWLEAAPLPLLCWDRSSRDDDATAGLLARLGQVGATAGALVGFGGGGLELLPPPPELAAAARSMERFAAAVAAAGQAADAPRPSAAPATAAPSPAPSPPAAAGSPARSVPAASAKAPAAPRGREASPAGDGRRRAFVLAAALVVALAGAWLLLIGPPGERVPLSSLAPVGDAEDISPPAAADSQRAASVPAAADSGLAAAADSAAAGSAAGRAAAASLAPADTAAPAVAAAGVGFDMAPYRGPVGREGWALHVFSQPDSALARRQIEELAAAGFQGEARAVELPGKGRWFRIYMGSFPTREAATAALPRLLARLGEEWGQVVRH